MNNSDFIARFVSTSRYGVQYGNLRVTCLWSDRATYLRDVEKIGIVLYSYETPIAVRTNDGAVYWTERRFSPTTARHLSILESFTGYKAKLPSGIIPRADIRAITSTDLAAAIGCGVASLHQGMSGNVAFADDTFWFFNAEYNADIVSHGGSDVEYGALASVVARSRPVWQVATAYEYHDGRAAFTAHVPRVGDLRVALLEDHATVQRAIVSYVRGSREVEHIGEVKTIDTSDITYPRGTRKANRETRIAEAVAEVYANTLQFPQGTAFYRPE